MRQLTSVAVATTKAPWALSWKSIEYYTPRKYVEAARAVMGSIDCDPASNDLANQIVQATVYYTKETNGLNKPWRGNVWLNPPYGKEGNKANQLTWSQRLIESYQAGITKQAVLLVTAAVETKWFQVLMDYPFSFPARRINFYTPDGTEGGATCASAFFYLGPNIVKFRQVFRQFGRVVIPNPEDIPRPTGLWEPMMRCNG